VEFPARRIQGGVEDLLLDLGVDLQFEDDLLGEFRHLVGVVVLLSRLKNARTGRALGCGRRSEA